MITPFSENYAEAREKFLAAARAAGLNYPLRFG